MLACSPLAAPPLATPRATPTLAELPLAELPPSALPQTAEAGSEPEVAPPACEPRPEAEGPFAVVQRIAEALARSYQDRAKLLEPGELHRV